MRRLLASAVIVFCACQPQPQYVEQATKVQFEVGGDFWTRPIPSELRKQDDGTYDYNRWPGPHPDLMQMWLTTLDDRVRDGWGVNAGAFFTMTADIDVATLPTAEASLTESASVQLIDIDPGSKEYGRRFPLDVSYTSAAITMQPEKMLHIVPVQGFPRRELTTYAVILTSDLKDTGGKPVGASRTFWNALHATKDADAKAVAALAPLKTFIDAKKLDAEKIVGGTVFKTIDPNETLKKLATWVDTLPVPELEEPWTLVQDYGDFVLYTARYRVPFVQSGDKPGHGRVVWNDAKTAPVQQGTQSVRLSLGMPKTAAPASGQPLMIYFHGSGGEYREVMDRGPLPQTAPRDPNVNPVIGTGPSTFLARRGIATMGFDFPLHGDRDNPPDTSGLKLYNLFGDIDSTVDNMSVGAMEVVYLTRLVEAVELPGGAHVDMNKLTAMGHSMGSTIGIPVSTVDPRIKAYVFSGSGGLLLEVGTETTYPTSLHQLIELLLEFKSGETLTRTHPLLHAFQTLWDLTDPVAKARHTAVEPYPGHVAHPYFQPMGILDGYFHPEAQAAAGGALQTTLIGEPAEGSVLQRTLTLQGRGALATYPLHNNLNGVTAGTAQYAVPFELGHYIVFDMTSVQSQVACFLAGVGTPEGPSIVSPRGVDDACE